MKHKQQKKDSKERSTQRIFRKLIQFSPRPPADRDYERREGAGASMEPTEERNLVLNFFDFLGWYTIAAVRKAGAIAIFFSLSFVKIFQARQFPEIVQQVFSIGARSTSIVVLIGLFAGMVLGLQLFFTLTKFGSQGVLGSVVALSLIRELGPVLTAIMITARAGSAMAAEIGILRISEQIDALYTMQIDPQRYLISPRLAACIISFPLLTAFFDLIGILGGYFTGVVLLGVDKGAYIYRIHSYVDIADIRGGFIKSVIFAAIVGTTCCYQGYFAHLRTDTSGAKSVSRATTSAVVISCVLILIADYIVTSFLM